jgi:hypothetical protein
MPQAPPQPKLLPLQSQRLTDSRIHAWYHPVTSFSDELVRRIVTYLAIGQDDLVIDPFCGSGTTLVECKRLGIPSIGIDANPASHFAARTKTNWGPRPERVLDLLSLAQQRHPRKMRALRQIESDPTYKYLLDSGMIDRGWISPAPLRKAIAIKQVIKALPTTKAYKDLLLLALIAEVVWATSNVKFGPELYCGDAKEDHDVLLGFSNRVRRMSMDLLAMRDVPSADSLVIWGDSRSCAAALGGSRRPRFSALITSPPYPAEHDYTRNTRLELAFLEQVTDRSSLQAIKRGMIRASTKGVYEQDNDARHVMDNPQISALSRRLARRANGKAHGFARLYPRVVQEYFGGMKRHLASISKVLKPGSYCAYVIGDQSSYLRVHIPTADILSSIAQEVGFQFVEKVRWRTRWSTTTSSTITENILILRKPAP